MDSKRVVMCRCGMGYSYRLGVHLHTLVAFIAIFIGRRVERSHDIISVVALYLSISEHIMRVYT